MPRHDSHARARTGEFYPEFLNAQVTAAGLERVAHPALLSAIKRLTVSLLQAEMGASVGPLWREALRHIPARLTQLSAMLTQALQPPPPPPSRMENTPTTQQAGLAADSTPKHTPHAAAPPVRSTRAPISLAQPLQTHQRGQRSHHQGRRPRRGKAHRRSPAHNTYTPRHRQPDRGQRMQTQGNSQPQSLPPPPKLPEPPPLSGPWPPRHDSRSPPAPPAKTTPTEEMGGEYDECSDMEDSLSDLIASVTPDEEQGEHVENQATSRPPPPLQTPTATAAHATAAAPTAATTSPAAATATQTTAVPQTPTTAPTAPAAPATHIPAARTAATPTPRRSTRTRTRGAATPSGTTTEPQPLSLAHAATKWAGKSFCKRTGEQTCQDTMRHCGLCQTRNGEGKAALLLCAIEGCDKSFCGKCISQGCKADKAAKDLGRTQDIQGFRQRTQSLSWTCPACPPLPKGRNGYLIAPGVPFTVPQHNPPPSTQPSEPRVTHSTAPQGPANGQLSRPLRAGGDDT